MRKISFKSKSSLLIVFLSFFFFSCGDDDKDTATKSSAKAITAFSFESSKNKVLADANLGDLKGVIDESQKTIKFSVTLPSGVDKATVEDGLKSLKATFTASAKATVKVGQTEQKSGETENDFSKEVKYTVTAEDDTTQDYAVTIELKEAAKSSEKKITAFSFESNNNKVLADANLGDLNGVIDESQKTIKFSVTLPSGVDKATVEDGLKSLKATFTASAKATVKVGQTDQKSGETTNDFSQEVKYTVTAEDGTTQDYTVTIELKDAPPAGKSSDKKITAFSFEISKNKALTDAKLKDDLVGVIDDSQKTIKFSVTLPSGVDKAAVETALKSLKATFTASAKATVKVGNTEQKTGETANDFSQEVKYTVTAEDGTTQDYTVTVELKETEIITYEGHVKAIMTRYCTRCHGASNPRAGLSLSNYTQVKDGSSQSNSRMNNASNPMPPSGLISKRERDIFTKWIDDGLKEKN